MHLCLSVRTVILATLVQLRARRASSKKSGNTAADPSNIFSNENSENGAQVMFSATITGMVIGTISSIAFLLPALIVTIMKRRKVSQRHVKPRFKGKSPSPYSGTAGI